MTNTLYETDLYAWTQRQVALLREEEFEQVDWDNVIEEIASLGSSQQNEVESGLIVILMHLLKWQYQPSKRVLGRSWRKTITTQRIDLDYHLSKNPSLRARLPALLPDVYRVAVRKAAAETGLDKRVFPPECPWTAAQIMDEDFWPAVEWVVLRYPIRIADKRKGDHEVAKPVAFSCSNAPHSTRDGSLCLVGRCPIGR